jgi:hypothetical protein
VSKKAVFLNFSPGKKKKKKKKKKKSAPMPEATHSSTDREHDEQSKYKDLGKYCSIATIPAA